MRAESDALPSRSRSWTVVFWVIAIATALPLLATRYLPFTDLPEHVATMATLARMMPGGGGAPYELALGDSQYLLFDGLGALVTRIIGDAILANQLLLVAVALLWPLSARSLLRSTGRDERIAIFAPMVFWNRATVVGFEPYVASVAVAMFTLAIVVRYMREPTWRRAASVAALALIVFYTHASSYLLLALTAAALAGALVARDRAQRRMMAVRAATILAALVPSALAALAWWRIGSLTELGAPGGVDRMPIGESVFAMPIWTFDIWRSHLDEVAAAMWWLAFAVVVVASWRRSKASSADTTLGWVVWVPFACAAAVYLTTPFRIGGAAMLNVRLAPALALFALLGLELRKDRASNVALAMAAAATLLTAGNAALQIRRVAREKVGDLDVILAAMRPDARVVMLNFERSSPRMHFWPYVFAGSYHRVRSGGLASYSFSELPHWPVHYARGTAPPAHNPLWIFHPCEYRYAEDGAFYDYVLVQGPVDPFDGRQGTLGPRFLPITREAAFTLYEKTSPPPDAPHEADRGPCIARPPSGP